MNNPILISSGDISGINLYIFLKSAQKFRREFHIVINKETLKLYADFFNIEISKNIKTISINKQFNKVFVGKVNDLTSEISYKSLIKSIEVLKMDLSQYAGFITLPVNKSEMQKFIPDFAGHTEFIAKEFSCNVSMLLHSEVISVVPITTHISLNKIEGLINKKTIYNNLTIIKNFYLNYFNKNPHITPLCMNPHCSDNGLLGENDKMIENYINELKNEFNIDKPISSDTAFNKAFLRKTDVYLCMYHDQALIPFKMLAFEEGINITAGLPFLRISPDHGPAYDKVNDIKNISTKSLENAMDFIIKKAP